MYGDVNEKEFLFTTVRGAMQVFREVDEIREWRVQYRIDQTSIALIYTKGNIHDGHISLIRQAKMECDLVIVTTFMNRLEFCSDKDYKEFPRNEENDIKRLEKLGYVDVLFWPQEGELALEEDHSEAESEGTFEIARRPELFKGRRTILLRLLELLEPSQIYVGFDCIQLHRYLQTLMNNQSIPVEIVGVPLYRRPDGLPYSTQIDMMTNHQVEIARRVFPCLLCIIEEYLEGELDAKMMVRKARYELECPELLVDYFAIVDKETFEPVERIDPDKGGILIIGVVVKGEHKLMDNVVLAPLDRSKPKFFARRVTKPD